MSELDKAFGGLVEVMMDWERRLKDVEIELADFLLADQPVTRKAVEPEEWARLRRIEQAATRLLEFSRPMGDADRIKAWDALAKAVRGNGL